MQTVLGSNGQIGHELAKELYEHYTTDIRLVGRNPKKIHESDQLVKADLLKLDDAMKAVSGSEIVNFTVGLPMDSQMWEEQFLIITENVIKACQQNNSKLVFFDNTYMYEKNAIPQIETSSFAPKGRKSIVRAKIAERIQEEMTSGRLEAVICRAPEFYGPGNTQSITNTMIFKPIKADKKLKVPISDRTLRTLIWTPDASRAMALIGNTKEAYNQTWHLPCAEQKTYKELIKLTESILDKKLRYSVIKMWQFKLGSYFNQNLKELEELLPRYQVDNIFVSDKFKTYFPDFKITTFEEGIQQIFS